VRCRYRILTIGQEGFFVPIVDEFGASPANIKLQFWLDDKTYSIFKVRLSLLRQVKRVF